MLLTFYSRSSMILVMQRTPARNSMALRWTGNESLIQGVKSECKFQTEAAVVAVAAAAAAAADTAAAEAAAVAAAAAADTTGTIGA